MFATWVRTHGLLTLLAGVALVLSSAGRAHGQTAPETFQAAREAYTRGSYQEVVDLLEPMVGGEVPSSDILDDRVLVRESRKYLGAAYLLTGHREDAIRQFEALLQAEGADLERYRLDPAAFAPAVHEAFDEVRARLLQRLRDERAELARQQRASEQRRRDAVLRLVALAEEDEVDVPNDPVLAWVPFGVGQFQNGDAELGVFFAVSETLLVTTASVSLAAYLSVLAQHERALVLAGPPVDTNVLVALSVLNWVSVGAAVVLLVTGITESVLGYVPRRTVRRRRELPPQLLQELDLGLSPSGLVLGARF